MEENVKGIAESMFAILHKYASAGLSKGDNFDLVVAAFKVRTSLHLFFLFSVFYL